MITRSSRPYTSLKTGPYEYEEEFDIPARQSLETNSVLLVDDDFNFRTIVELTLQSLGYAVEVASSAGQAIEIASQNKDIQLLITDVVMPGLNGVELAGEIQRILPHVKVLAISGFSLKMVTGMGVCTDSVHFLQKPFHPTQFHKRIKAILAGA